jgi:hypothetical protein
MDSITYLELADGINILRELVDDNSHKQLNEIQQELKKLYNEMIESGYIPNTNFVTLRDMNEEEKEHHLCSHSEKLAIGLGLISIPLLIAKNLRVYPGCHSTTKILYNREITVAILQKSV